MQVVGQPARDLARHFIQRYDRHSFLVHYWTYRQMELSAENKGLYMSGSVSSGNSVMICHRITHESCRSYCRRLNSSSVSWRRWASREHVRCKFVGPRVLGRWARRTRLSIQFRMPILKVCQQHPMTCQVILWLSCSNSNVRTFCLYRKPIFHNVVSPSRQYTLFIYSDAFA